jgi:hypothetical protein
VIPVENEETQQLIERHASSPKDEPFNQSSKAKLNSMKQITPQKQNEAIDVTDQMESKQEKNLTASQKREISQRSRKGKAAP